ncbi:Crp/Fnr family transcriptional regulator [Hyphomicrobium sp. 99]|uniref:Crp/Fnr family transcriptional regulator n=1 Tax=Hyphomicrobium sp. 99 TaxID=1163419 RepID=UPI0009E259C2|nr:Crp/Fnr family transcriptional regulator [Hyphomicrobium sp. 99]
MQFKTRPNCVLPLRLRDIACLSEVVSGPQYFKRGTEFVHEGQASHKAYLLQSGWACCYKNLREGGRQIISFPLPGDFIGLGSLLLRSSDHSFAALSDIVVSSFSTANIITVFQKHPSIATAVLRSASRDQAMLVEHLVDIGRRGAIERVAHCLLELRHRLQLAGLASSTQFGCPLTQYDLADALGLSPIHVNRVLRQLRERGLLTMKAHTVIIHDLAALIDVARYEGSYIDQGGIAHGEGSFDASYGDETLRQLP